MAITSAVIAGLALVGQGVATGVNSNQQRIARNKAEDQAKYQAGLQDQALQQAEDQQRKQELEADRMNQQKQVDAYRAAAANRLKALSSRQGRQGTILTGPLGIKDSEGVGVTGGQSQQTTPGATLLGA
jgi:hypothetical protein